MSSSTPGRELADGDIAVVAFTAPEGVRGRVVKHVRTGVVHDGGLLLVSSNQAYPPMIILAGSRPAIEGVVVGVARERPGGHWEYFRCPAAGSGPRPAAGL